MRAMLRVTFACMGLAIATPAAAQEAARLAAAERLLEKLVESYGVSGVEGRVRQLVVSQLPSWAKPETDSLGRPWYWWRTWMRSASRSPPSGMTAPWR